MLCLIGLDMSTFLALYRLCCPVVLALFLLLVGWCAVFAYPDGRARATDGPLLALVYDRFATAERVAHLDPTTGAITPYGNGVVNCCDQVALDSAFDIIGGRLYAILSGLDVSAPRLFTFDLATGAVVADAPLTTTVSYDFLTVDPVTERILAVVFDSVQAREQLVRMDPATGALTPVGAGIDACCTVTAFEAALDAVDRRLFMAMRPLTGTAPALYTVDIDTGNLLSIQALSPFVSVNYLAFDAQTGKLWSTVFDPQANATRMAIVDPQTGGVTPVGAGAADCCALYPSDAALDGVSNRLSVPLLAFGAITPDLYTFDLATGAVVYRPALSPDYDIHAVGSTRAPILPVPELSVRKRGPATAPPGARIEFTLAVSNIGAAAAVGVVVTDSLPVGVVAVAASPGAIVTPGTKTVGTQVRWMPGALPVDAGHTFTIAVEARTTLVNAAYAATASGVIESSRPPPIAVVVGDERSESAQVVLPQTSAVITGAGDRVRVTLPPGTIPVTTTCTWRPLASQFWTGVSPFWYST